MADRIVYLLFAGVLVALTVVGLVRALRASRARRLAIGGVLVWLAAFVFMTVGPGNGRGVRLNLVPFVVDGPGSAFDAVLNVLVVVPPGLLLATLGWRLLPVLGSALAVSLAVEVTQYVTDVGRTADVNDLLTNVAGAGLGWLLGWAVLRLRAPRDREPDLENASSAGGTR